MLKAVIFDMDGVLVDSELLHYRANVNVLKKYGVSLDYDYYKQFIGTSCAVMWKKIQQDFALSTDWEELSRLGDVETEKLVCTDGYQPVSGAVQLVRMLKQQGYILAVASSSSLENIHRTIQALHLSDCFACFVSSETVAHPKPAPDIYQKAAELLNISPLDCLAIEDSQNGVDSALAAKMACLGFVNPALPSYHLNKVQNVTYSLENIGNNSFGIPYLSMVHAHQCNQSWELAATDRCLIREITLQDIDALYELYAPPEITQYIEGLYENRAQETEFIQAYIGNMYRFYGYGLWVIVDKTTNRLIGRAGLSHRQVDGQTEIELGYIIAKDRQGEGLAYEVCKKIMTMAKHFFDIEYLLLFTQKENIPSVRLAQKLGFTYYHTYTQGDCCYDCYKKIL